MEVMGLENRFSSMVVIFLLAVLVAVSFGMAQDSSITSGNQKNEMDDAAIESNLLNNAAESSRKQSIRSDERSRNLEILSRRNGYSHGFEPIHGNNLRAGQK